MKTIINLILAAAVLVLVGAGCGGGSSTPTNTKPTANAGPAQDVNAAVTVTLDGSGSSDPDGNPLTYAWTQTSGTTVVLSSATAEKPTFTATNIPDTLVFQLIVNDGTADSDPSTVTIRVWMDAAARLFVNKDSASTATPDGTTANPYLTITDAIGAAASGTDVYVARSTAAYSENITMKTGVGLFGGYEAVNWTRDITTNTTTISPTTANSPTVTAGTGLTSATYLNGFAITGPAYTSSTPSASVILLESGGVLTISQNTISGGSSTSDSLSSIICTGGGTGPVISDNTITIGSMTSATTTHKVQGIDINCASAVISGNTIWGSSDETFSAAGGVYLITIEGSSSATIEQNTLSAGKNVAHTQASATTGIAIINSASATITRNKIDGGDGYSQSVALPWLGSCGIADLSSGTVTIENNIIYAGNGYTDGGFSYSFDSAAVTTSTGGTGTANVINNTIYIGGSTAANNPKVGIGQSTASTFNAVNNLVIQNSATQQACFARLKVTPSVSSNSFNSVRNNDCDAVSGGYFYFLTGTAIATTTSVDAMETQLNSEISGSAANNLGVAPSLQTGSDYLLVSDSPLIGAGYSVTSGGVVTLPTDDYDGNVRPTGAGNTWDIGADQYYAP